MWTLTEARKHYQEQNPTCNLCSFSMVELVRVGNEYYCMDKHKIKCRVREDYVVNTKAKECVYFTSNL